MKYRVLESAHADGDAGGGGQQAAAPDRAQVERQARDLGWSPKEQWRGNPQNWVDADAFVKRGETFVPFLKAERAKLRGELDTFRNENAQVRQELQQTRAQLSELTKFNREMAADRQDRKKAEIATQLRAAREAGDDVKVAELSHQLSSATAEAEKLKAPPTTGDGTPANAGNPNSGAPNGQQQPAIQPWVRTFVESNEDFFKDPYKATLFNTEMQIRRNAGDRRVGDTDGTALLNEALTEVERRLGSNAQRRSAPSKTEEPRPGSRSSGGGSGQTYFDMPADAQGKCDSQEARFVGEGKAFKSKDDWRKHFVAEYFA